MSSLARISLRTTAAAAGIAAIAVGLAGQALAAEPPALPGADALTGAGLPAAPDLSHVANVELPSVSTAGPELPALEAFELPQLAAAAPEAPGLPDAASLPTAPDAASLPAAPEVPALPFGGNGVGNGMANGIGSEDVDAEADSGNDVNGMDVSTPQGSALSGIDSAAMFLELAQ